jgi:hypothetical protein
MSRRVRASATYQRASAVYNELHGGSSLRRIGHALKSIDVADVTVQASRREGVTAGSAALQVI